MRKNEKTCQCLKIFEFLLTKKLPLDLDCDVVIVVLFPFFYVKMWYLKDWSKLNKQEK